MHRRSFLGALFAAPAAILAIGKSTPVHATIGMGAAPISGETIAIRGVDIESISALEDAFASVPSAAKGLRRLEISSMSDPNSSTVIEARGQARVERFLPAALGTTGA